MTAWFMWRVKLLVLEQPWTKDQCRGLPHGNPRVQLCGGCGTADRQRNPCCFSLYSFRQPGTAETGGEKALPPPQGETLCHLCCFLSPTPGSPFGHHQTVYAVGPFYESRYNNEAVCVFVGRDDTGTGRFACVRGIAGDLKKTSAAVISGLASATRRISRAAATWRFLRLRLTPSPMLRSKSWRAGNGMATGFPWVGLPLWPWSLSWSATRRSPALPSIWTMTLRAGSTPGKSRHC